MYFSPLNLFIFFLSCITLILCYLYIILFFLLFVFFFFFFLKAVKSTFRMEEMYHSVSQQLDDERKRRIAAVQTLTIAENSNADLKQKLKAEEQERKSANSALKSAET